MTSNEIEEEEQKNDVLQQVQQLSEREQKQSPTWLTLNRLAILLEKSFLTNRGYWMAIEFCIPILFAWYLKSFVISGLSSFFQTNGSTPIGPLYPPTVMDTSMWARNHFYLVKEGGDAALVDNFINNIKYIPHINLTFTKVDNTTSLNWWDDSLVNGLYFPKLLLSFDSTFNRSNLHYDIVRPDWQKENLTEKWSLVNGVQPYSEDGGLSNEVTMHFIICETFKYWTIQNQNITDAYMNLHPFELEAFYHLKPFDFNFNLGPNMFALYSFVFLLLMLTSMMTYHTVVFKEAEDKSKEFLKLMGASNSQILGVNAIYFLLQTSVTMILPIIYFYSQDVYDNMPIWPTVLQLAQLYVGTGVHVQLLALIFSNLTFSRLLLMIHLTMTGFSLIFKDYGWYWILFYPGPFFSFHVNWQLSLDALYDGGSASKLFQPNPDYQNLSWAESYTVSWLLIGLNFLVLLYLSECWPFQHGNIRPFYYIFNRTYWFGNDQQKMDPMPAQNLERFEPPQTSPIICIRSLLKGFRSGAPKFQWQPVIRNLNFDFHDNQITALLGFNGAGKTTLIDLITGMNTIEGGQIRVADKNVQTETSTVRSSLGLCPQANLFYRNLSVGQNLRLAAVMKGISFRTADKKAELAASLVNLKDQINKKAGDLSGGMKRRLCLACAIIGNWNVLILDEPTSGLDPETRRDIWDLLLQIRKVRTILLTTHFMEEADVLADRIAIMAGGEIVCAGSASFLKRAFQTGYVLNVQPKSDRKTLLKQIQQHVPSAKLYGEKANEMSIQLIESTEQDSQKLNEAMISLFRWLESSDGQECVQSFNLTNTSLEDVFLKVGEERKALSKVDQKICDPFFDDISMTESVGDRDNILLINRPKGFQKVWVQFWAIVYKRLCYEMKQLIATIRMIILPLFLAFLLTAMVNYFYNLYFAIGQPKSTKINFHDLYPQAKTLFSCDGLPANVEQLQRYVDKATVLGLDPIVLYNASTNLTSYIQTRADLTQNPKEYAFGITIGDDSFKASRLTLWPNYVYKYSLLAATSFILEEQADQNDANQGHEIRLGFNWKPYQASINVYPSFINTSIAGMIQLSLIFLVYVSMNALTCPQEELKRSAFFMQQVAGISKNVYWATNHFFDYFNFAACVTLMLTLLTLLDKSGLFTLSGHALDVATVYLSGITLIASAFLFVRLLYKSKFLSTLYNFYIVIGMVAPVLTILSYEGTESPVSQVKQVITFALFPQAAFAYSFVRIMYQNGMQICNHEQNYECEGFVNSLPTTSKQDETFYFYVVLSMAILSILINSCDQITDPICDKFTQLFVMITNRKQFNDGEGLRHHPKVDDAIVEEENEVERIVQTQDFQDQVLVASRLQKKFANKMAVNDISFKIRNQECFGLLGLNGAGKSTTFSMLTGEKSITSGQVYLNGQKLKSNKMKNFYQLFSYCPQTECHFKDLTVLQTLLFYLRAQGSSSSSPASSACSATSLIANRIIELTDLQDYSHSTADNLSGGNKRKLSLAIALIGVPNLILLDEPTTGVDPVARRKIWNCLNLHRKIGRCTYLLTSHSMDECEYLCDRIAIMANGKLRCLGTASELKQNYAQGFKITFKVKYHHVNDQEYAESVKLKVFSCFGDKISFQEMHMNTMIFVLKDFTFAWSTLFARMQLLSKDLQLLDFWLEATSLEEVFLSFAD